MAPTEHLATSAPARPERLRQLWHRRWPTLAVALSVLGLWQAWVVLAEVPVYLLPSPLDVARTLVHDRTLLLPAWFTTVKIAVLALLAATAIGVLLAFAFVQSRRLEDALFPYAVLLQVTPIVAIAPLIIIWVKDPTAALVLCATLVALFPVLASTITGLRSVNPALADYFRLIGASRWQLLWRLRVPSALPHFLNGLRIAGGLALIGAVVAEFVAGTGGTSTGLAYQILQSGYQLDIRRLFAALALISLTGVGQFLLLAALSRRLLRGWHERDTDR